VYLALSPLSVTLQKKERREIKIKIKTYGSVVHYSIFSPPLDDSCLSIHASSLYAGMFWFGSIGYTSFKLSMVLSLKFGCNDRTSIGFLV
jgi:hypothetical protein